MLYNIFILSIVVLIVFGIMVELNRFHKFWLSSRETRDTYVRKNINLWRFVCIIFGLFLLGFSIIALIKGIGEYSENQVAMEIFPNLIMSIILIGVGIYSKRLATFFYGIKFKNKDGIIESSSEVKSVSTIEGNIKIFVYIMRGASILTLFIAILVLIGFIGPDDGSARLVFGFMYIIGAALFFLFSYVVPKIMKPISKVLGKGIPGYRSESNKE